MTSGRNSAGLRPEPRHLPVPLFQEPHESRGGSWDVGLTARAIGGSGFPSSRFRLSSPFPKDRVAKFGEAEGLPEERIRPTPEHSLARFGEVDERDDPHPP